MAVLSTYPHSGPRVMSAWEEPWLGRAPFRCPCRLSCCRLASFRWILAMSILPDGDGEEYSIDTSTKEPCSEGGLLKDGICPEGTETGCAGSDDETLSETMRRDESIISDEADDEACSSRLHNSV